MWYKITTLILNKQILITFYDLRAVFDWPHLQLVVIAGISAALSYLLKTLLTNSRNQLFRKEPG
ncbi:MAG: hypothetical protein WC854_13320 [Bacteroidales bacterium]